MVKLNNGIKDIEKMDMHLTAFIVHIDRHCDSDAKLPRDPTV
jgi:hypothetical protein